MGLNLSSNNGHKGIRFSYSGFNRIRYLVLSYVQQEDFSVVSNNTYLYHFLSAYSEHDYAFKNLIEHSDSDGFWNKEQINHLNKEFHDHYPAIVEHAKKQDQFFEGMDDTAFEDLIEFLSFHLNKDDAFITFS